MNYYHTCGDLYLFSSEFSEGTDFNKENLEKAQQYREKWRQASVDTLSLGAVSNRADLIAWRGDNRRALDLLENYMKSHKGIEGRDYSIMTSTIAFLYGTLGNKPMQKRYLLLSAINDVKNCIRENNSLRELASLLFDEGDINHAYKYLNASIQDANFYGTRLRNAQVAQFVPKVIEEYYQSNKSHRQFLTAFLVVLAVIVVALIVTLVFMRRYLYRYRQEKEKVEQANRMLNANVMQMEKTNTLLKVHSAIKEQYIGRFMELVSVVIERTEAQRKQANRLARDHKLPELYSLLKSTEYVSQNTKLVTSVPGMGTQNALSLMVYTDNFRKFNYDSRKIACYYGIAPFGKDSGTSVHSDPHVHFMANKQLKAILTQAALSASIHNPVIRDYYQRLLARGKKKQVAMNNVKNKLLHIVTAMVRNHQLFNPEYRISA